MPRSSADLLVPLALTAALLLAGCQSPEATRTRGGGSGADVGNRGASVDLHGKPDPFHGTPTLESPR